MKIIARKPCYSQEIVQALKEHGFVNMSEGTLFPLLLRLEKEGLFETRKITNPLGPSRKYYSLSESGVKELSLFSQTWRRFSETVNTIMSDGVMEDEK